MDNKDVIEGVISAVSSPAYKAALESERAELLAMADGEVERKLTFDPSLAATMAESTAKKIAPFRSELVAKFGAEAGALVDALPRIARATLQADVEVDTGATPVDLSAMHEQVRTAHRLLITDADSLANRGLLEARRIDAARDVQGYEAVIRSLLKLVSILREQWGKVEAHTPLTRADLDRAAALAQTMTRARGDRDNGVDRGPAVELRSRAATKLKRVHEELRRMMTFLRWYHGDVDALIPSLWTSRNRKPRSTGGEPGDTDTDTDTDTDDTDLPVITGPVNGGPPFTS